MDTRTEGSCTCTLITPRSMSHLFFHLSSVVAGLTKSNSAIHLIQNTSYICLVHVKCLSKENWELSSTLPPPCKNSCSEVEPLRHSTLAPDNVKANLYVIYKSILISLHIVVSIVIVLYLFSSFSSPPTIPSTPLPTTPNRPDCSRNLASDTLNCFAEHNEPGR